MNITQDWDLLKQDFNEESIEEYFTVIVIYDIISDRRRSILCKILNSFGYRIQKSVFECNLTKIKYNLLIKEIDKFANPEDLIRIYKLNKNVKTLIYGKDMGKNNEIYYFF